MVIPPKRMTLVDLVLGYLSVLDCAVDGGFYAIDYGACDLLELGTGHSDVHVLGTIRTHGDVWKIDVGAEDST